MQLKYLLQQIIPYNIINYIKRYLIYFPFENGSTNYDIIVINGGSIDMTSKLAKETKKAIVVDLVHIYGFFIGKYFVFK